MNSLAVQFFLISVLSLPRSQVQSLAREQRYHKTHGLVKQKKSIFIFSRDTDKTRSKENHKVLNSLFLWACIGVAKEFVWVSYKIVGKTWAKFLAKPKFYINFISVKVARKINRHITHIIKRHLYVLQYIRTG